MKKIKYTPPTTTAEFLERYPNFAGQISSNMCRGLNDDLEQAIITTWIARKSVERFDPARTGGDNEQRFLSYMKLCARNVYLTGLEQNSREPLFSAVSIVDDPKDDEGMDESFITTNSYRHRGAEVDPDTRIFIQEFRSYVLQQPDGDYLCRVMDAEAISKNRTEAARDLHITYAQVKQAMGTLRELGKNFMECGKNSSQKSNPVGNLLVPSSTKDEPGRWYPTKHGVAFLHKGNMLGFRSSTGDLIPWSFFPREMLEEARAEALEQVRSRFTAACDVAVLLLKRKQR